MTLTEQHSSSCRRKLRWERQAGMEKKMLRTVCSINSLVSSFSVVISLQCEPEGHPKVWVWYWGLGRAESRKEKGWWVWDRIFHVLRNIYIYVIWFFSEMRVKRIKDRRNEGKHNAFRGGNLEVWCWNSSWRKWHLPGIPLTNCDYSPNHH